MTIIFLKSIRHYKIFDKKKSKKKKKKTKSILFIVRKKIIKIDSISMIKHFLLYLNQL